MCKNKRKHTCWVRRFAVIITLDFVTEVHLKIYNAGRAAPMHAFCMLPSNTLGRFKVGGKINPLPETTVLARPQASRPDGTHIFFNCAVVQCNLVTLRTLAAFVVTVFVTT